MTHDTDRDIPPAATTVRDGSARTPDPLRFLLRASSTLSASLDLQETLDTLLGLIVPELADMASVYLPDSAGRFMREAARHRLPELAALSAELGPSYVDSDLRPSPVWQFVERGEWLLTSPVTDAYIESVARTGEQRRILRAFDMTATLAMPLVARGRPVGLLGLGTVPGRAPLSRATAELVEELARRAALAIDNARLHRAAEQSRIEAERARQRMTFLANASAALATSLDHETTLRTIARLSIPLLGDCCTIVLRGADGVFRRMAVAHVDPALQERMELGGPVVPIRLDGPHPTAEVVRTGRPAVIERLTDAIVADFSESHRYYDQIASLGLQSALTVPLEVDGRVFGSIGFATADPARRYTPDDISLADALARRATQAIENARLHRDIQNANDRLERQLGFTDAVLRNIGEGVMVFDDDSKLAYINPVGERMLGQPAAELLGQDAHEISHVAGDDGQPTPRRDCRITRVREQGEVVRVDSDVFIRSDGSFFPVSITAAPMWRDGAIVGTVSVFRDISEQSRARAELQQSQEELRRALRAAKMVTWERDLDTGRTHRSEFAAELYGRANDELADDDDDPLRLVHPDDRAWVDAQATASRRSSDGYVTEYRVIWPDGTVRWVSSRAQVFHDAGGRARSISGTTHDITERKLAELQLRRLLDERRDETAELLVLHQRLQRSLEAVLGLRAVGQVLTSADDLDSTGKRLLAIAVRAAHLRSASLRLRRGPSLQLWQQAGTDPIRGVTSRLAAARARSRTLTLRQSHSFQIRDPLSREVTLTGWCVVLVIRDEVVGVLEAVGELGPNDGLTLEILESIAHQTATAIENERLYRELADSEHALRRLVHELMRTQEAERAKLAFELHDGVAQTTIGVQQLLQAIGHLLSSDDAASARRQIDVAIGLARRSVGEVRRVMAGLRPTVVDDLGLAGGLRSQVEQLRDGGFRVSLRESLDDVRLRTEVEIALVRVAQEALTNAQRHAGVDTAEVWLSHRDGCVLLEVKDTGRGFDPSAQRAQPEAGMRLGLLGMRERMRQVGGTLWVESRPNGGTTVRASVPVATDVDGAALAPASTLDRS